MAPEVLQLRETIQTQQGVIERLEATILKQQQQLEQLMRQLYGRKSDRELLSKVVGERRKSVSFKKANKNP